MSLKLGKGTERDFKLAAEYFLVAGKMGHAKAMTELGTMCMIGYGVERNADLA